MFIREFFIFGRFKSRSVGLRCRKGSCKFGVGFWEKEGRRGGGFWFFKTLCVLVRCLFIYYRVFLVEEVVYEEIKEIDDRCRYN